MKQISVPKINLSSVKEYDTIDSIDTDFAIFDNINNIPLFNYPSIIETAVFALCLEGNCKNNSQHDRILTYIRTI